MKTIICSDLHLAGDFDATKFEYLKDLFSDCDQLIINGDFWDGYEIRFEKFVKTPWSRLFPIMLAKNTVYIYGNHDKADWNIRPELFSTSQFSSYTLQVGKVELLIEHGHQFSPSFDITWPKLSYVLSSIVSSKRFRLGNELKGWENMQMKKYAKENLHANQLLVCGHSHIPENNRAHHYLNTGFIENGIASYIAIVGTSIKLVTETYG